MSLMICLMSGLLVNCKNEPKVIITTTNQSKPIDRKTQINKALKQELSFYNRKYSKQTIDYMNLIIRIAEHEYKINAYDLIALISLESNFKITARNRNSSSVDSGLTQQNSCCLKDRFNKVSKLLDKYNLKYNKSNKNDIGLNILSAAYFLNQIKTSLIKKNKYSDYRMFAIYNGGGNFSNKIATKYYKEIVAIKSRLLKNA